MQEKKKKQILNLEVIVCLYLFFIVIFYQIIP